ncbi:prolipoprotein diacylglyceryl transferase [Planosporangium thailandense]|uniref:Phosphatidylglycerol--prolipoprotein diacylglyceryl transferase n=1 Tax=Planosporangium thailandense TaxID=765197 RepID=A0ABX0XVD2_9ACTN|nr:prolipoprotein diacylglyceryl transferase [Planosporangium thailandense]
MNSVALTPLAEIPSPTQSVWHLGPLPVRAYALCIVLGIIAACAVTEIRMRRRGAPEWAVLDIAVWAVPFGIVGARIYHVITSPDAYFGAGGHPLDAFKIWNGGLGIWGAVAGGALGAWLGARRMGIPLAFVADALAPGLPLAQGLGRWGNWFNNELFGGRTSLPWGLQVHRWDGTTGMAEKDAAGHAYTLPGLYQPTFLYESLWDIGVAILVWQLDRRYRFGRGRAFALYVMAYTVGRFWVEALRDDPAHHFLGLRLNDWTAIIVFLGALIYFVRVRGPQQRLTVAEDGKILVAPAAGAAEAGAVAEPGEAGAVAEPGKAETAADPGEAAAEPAAETDQPPAHEPPADTSESESAPSQP